MMTKSLGMSEFNASRDRRMAVIEGFVERNRESLLSKAKLFSRTMIEFMQLYCDDPYVKNVCVALDMPLPHSQDPAKILCSKIVAGTVTQQDMDNILDTESLFDPHSIFFESLARASPKTFDLVSAWTTKLAQSNFEWFFFGLAIYRNEDLLKHLSEAVVPRWITRRSGKIPFTQGWFFSTVDSWSLILRFYDITEEEKEELFDSAEAELSFELMDLLIDS